METHSGGRRVPRNSAVTLTKRDVETLLANYDADPIGALTQALTRLAAPASLISSLEDAPLDVLDQMVKDLVEWRQLSDTQR